MKKTTPNIVVHTFQRVGAHGVKPVALRVVDATSRADAAAILANYRARRCTAQKIRGTWHVAQYRAA